MPISVASPPRIRGLAAPLRAIVRAALALEGGRPGEIAIVLADDRTLRDLNRQWRGIARATDVLSFSYDEALPSSGTGTRGRLRAGYPRQRVGLFVAKPRKELADQSCRREGRSPSRAPVTGDLVISLDRMEEQARRFRVTRGEELARLVVHGALHLAGLDHQRPADRRHMRAREALALRAARAQVRALDRALARR